MKSAFAILLASAAAAFAGSAAQAVQPMTLPGQSACQLEIQSPVGNWIIQGYDPFGSDPSQASFDLLFINNGNAQCRFFPRFATQGEPYGLARDSGGTRVLYSLFDSYGGYDATPIGGRTRRKVTQRQVVIAPHSNQTVRYVLTVNTDMLPGDGLFTQPLLIEAEDGTGEPVGQAHVNVGIDVTPSATIGLAGAYRLVHGHADVDLGQLAEGVVDVPLKLYIQSTRGYRLQVHSQNGGHLRLAGTDWEVPYSMIIDGHSIPLASDGQYSASINTGLRRETLPVGFAIGNVDNHRAGVYSDIVTVTVALF